MEGIFFVLVPCIIVIQQHIFPFFFLFACWFLLFFFSLVLLSFFDAIF